MDKRLRDINASKQRLVSLARRLGVAFLVVFALYCIGAIAVAIYALWPPNGFIRIGDGSLILLAPFLCGAITTGLTLYLLSRMFAEIGRGESPFTRLRVRQLQVLGALFLLTAVSNLFVIPGSEVGAQDGSLTLSFYSPQPAEGTIDVDFPSIVIAIICFALSLIFKYGALLQCETDDLV